MFVPPSEYEKLEFYPEDVHSTLTKIAPYLTKMLLEQARDEEQEIRIAALRGIEFLLEKLGCTLDNFMIDILRCIVTTYPKKLSEVLNEPLSHSPSEVFSKITDSTPVEKSKKHSRKDAKSHDFSVKERGIKAEPVQVKATIDCSFKASKKIIQVILDKYVSVLSSISSNILHQIFFDLLIKTLSEKEASNELKVLLIKIAEKIISICQGDLILNRK